MARRAKIVCTLGPATTTPDRVRALVEAGMDVARLNFSHGTQEDHANAYRLVREASDATGRSVGVLADLQGPKIRLGTFAEHTVMWATGDNVTITTEDVQGTHDRVSTTYDGLARDVRADDRLLINDGRVALQVTSVDANDVRCLVLEGGPVSDHKGISLPNVDVSVPSLSTKDAEDLRFALRLGCDFVAQSFVRTPDDIKLVHSIMDEVGIRVPVMVKIEKPEAVDNLEAIVAAYDSVMVARGDLGVEMPLEQVPAVQKRAVKLCRENAKPVVVATQMLESMIDNSRPTRAEVSDVANAVLDGADAVMLSGETSVGEYPIQVVQTMARIVESAEVDPELAVPAIERTPATKGGVIAASSCVVGARLGAAALVCFTQTGDTARRLARYHSELPLLAFTPVPSVRSQLSVTWGVETFLVPAVQHTDEMVRTVQRVLLSLGRFEKGDHVVIVAGSPPGIAGSTNALRVWRLGDEVPSG